jgi:hypothetical protein
MRATVDADAWPQASSLARAAREQRHVEMPSTPWIERDATDRARYRTWSMRFALPSAGDGEKAVQVARPGCVVHDAGRRRGERVWRRLDGRPIAR